MVQSPESTEFGQVSVDQGRVEYGSVFLPHNRYRVDLHE
jgi:hypothetical protein